MKNNNLNKLPVYALLSIFSFGCDTNNNDNPPVIIPPVNDWSRQPVDFLVDINDVHFINESVGWAVGKEEAVFTTTTGSVWSLAPAEEIRPTFRSVFFISSSKGWMAGDLKDIQAGGQVVYSGNGGASPKVQVVVNEPLNSVFFLNDMQGWAAGEKGLITRTEDGGENWTTANIGSQENIYDIQFVDANHGWAVTGKGGIYNSTDGVLWHHENTDTLSDLYAVHFIDSLHGWACGANSTILKRTKGENNEISWTPLNIPDEDPAAKWKDIFFIDPETGWVIGNLGRLYKTIDAGTTWTKETTEVVVNFNSIHMVNAGKGWIVGDHGTILTYTPK